MATLPTNQINDFIDQGFIRVENAFSADIANECRSLLWKATQCDPNDPRTWTRPVIRINEMQDEPFKNAANTKILHNAFDQLVGKHSWLPKQTLGTFPIRFPGKEPAGDTGWHVDASFPGENLNNYFDWRININSKGRALLMLFLFSDVDELDAPTIIKIGSHLDVAKILEPEGEQGLSFMELARKLDALPKREHALATGKAATVYLCHPFIVHTAQDHRGATPKFMAQPPLLTKEEFNIYRPEELLCPVEKAIAKGIRIGE
jgi:hypothetical protein